MHQFAGIDAGVDCILDETTILNFRHLLGQGRIELAKGLEEKPQSVHSERRTKVQDPRPSNQSS